MLVHVVLFWLKKNLDADQISAFREGVESLTRIKSADAAYVGTPAKTPERPVIDISYDVCLTVICKDVAAHNTYQVDPIHTDFLDQFKGYWEKVKIYDAD